GPVSPFAEISSQSVPSPGSSLEASSVTSSHELPSCVTMLPGSYSPADQAPSNRFTKSPGGPSGPGTVESAPAGPGSPCGPWGPSGPSGPGSPCGPAGPVGPAGPRGPVGSTPTTVNVGGATCTSTSTCGDVETCTSTSMAVTTPPLHG